MLESIPNDPSNFGPATCTRADWEECENPECDFRAERLTKIGSGLRVCAQCLEDLPRCENCDEQGGTPMTIEDEDGDSIDCCSLCIVPKRSVALAPFTDEECGF